MAIRIKQLKSGELRMYSGNKIATRDDKKAYFRANTTKPLKLSKDDAKLFTSVKGGVNRAKTATRDGGEFISRKADWDINRAKRVHIDVPELLKEVSRKYGKQYKNMRQLFKDIPESKKVYNSILKGVALPKFMSPNIAIDVIGESEASKFYVNGQEVTRSKMQAEINRVSTSLKRIFDPAGQAVKLNFVGADEVHVRLPTEEDLEKYHPEEVSYEDAMSFFEEFGEDYQMYISEPKPTP